MVAGTRDTYKSLKLDSLLKRLKNGENFTTSWVDLFFSHDIHIVGLGLDFIEIHLWWLLTYRSRVLNGHKLPRKNKIYYYYPNSREVLDQTKLRFLKAYGITTRKFDDNGGRKVYYSQVLDKLGSVK